MVEDACWWNGHVYPMGLFGLSGITRTIQTPHKGSVSVNELSVGCWQVIKNVTLDLSVAFDQFNTLFVTGA